MSLTVFQVAVEGLDDNFSYVIANTETKETAIVDPTGKIERVETVLQEQGLQPTLVLITHTHLDHYDQLAAVTNRYQDLVVYVHELGEEKVSSSTPAPVRSFEEGSVITLGNSEISVLHTPGHLNDSVCFYIAAAHSADGTPLLIAGDTLFVHGCGRTTPGEVEDLYMSLQRLKTLPSETIVFPGHDYGPAPTSTIGEELIHNKYFLAKDLEEFISLRLG
ncbi:MAG: hydroxyacylglutathione hydrolase family protein [Patescibacteria group bacterium]